MSTPKPASLLQNYLRIRSAAERSNDGHRCMIAPSPELKERLQKEFEDLRKRATESTLGHMLRPRMKKRVGLNDGVILPGNVFPLGSTLEGFRNAASSRRPLRGPVRVVVVLADFPDKAFATPKSYYEDLFFSENVIPTGSVREYFSEVTNGKVEITGEVVGPFRLPKKGSEYAHNESGTGDAAPNARTMAFDTAKLANPIVDFTPYDNDKDGFVDAFVVVHAGRGAEETGSPKDIWSHKWLLPSVFSADSTRIYSYLTIPEDCKLGVCAHELGHLLFGFPDLYDTEQPGEGVGDWCLMGGGSWNNRGLTPAHPCAWCKEKQGWVDVIRQSSNQGKVPLEDVKNTKTVYRLWKEGGPGHEYFLLENRQRTRFDRYLPGDGLLIWHVDDAIPDNSNEQHYKVALMQADGKKQLETGANRGDEKDAWTGKGKRSFTKSSKPHSRSYGGLDTGVAVRNISLKGGIITADLYVTSGPALPPKKKAAAPKAAAKGGTSRTSARATLSKQGKTLNNKEKKETQKTS